MQTERLLTFGPYRWDPHTGQLWRGKQEVRMTGKAAAVLRYLVGRAGQVVTKEELFAAVWPEAVVSDAALTSCIQELRRALHEQAKRPRYIATVHRRGFQFIGTVTRSQHAVVSRKTRESRSQESEARISSFPAQHSTLDTQHPVLVGREPELRQLHGWLEKALHGERQIVFVTGEPGIGKTTLVEAFLTRLANEYEHEHEIRIGRGQCVEHYGVGEAYLPVLEALGRLCREDDGHEVIALLRQQAPTWLAQMPALLSTAELEELQRRTAGVTQERMVRELAEALEALTAERALILRLEDLHWSDYSTLDLLSVLARRQEPARLLLIGTYRPVEVLTHAHPLKGVKQDLQLHGQCEELALDFLTEEDVAEYLAVRFNVSSPLVGEGQDGGALRQEHDRRSPHPLPLPRGERGAGLQAALQRLAYLIHQRTDGNPLFMVNVVTDLLGRGVLVPSDGRWELRGEEVESRVPENLQQLIEQQVERLKPEIQRLLEVASVAGAEFSAAAVAAGVEAEIDGIEEQCGELARQEHFLRASGTAEWPDGTVAAHYGFLHALYQDVLYHRLTARRRQRLHQQIGEREEQAYGDRAREIAAELVVHFERGRDYRRAIRYFQHAGQNAIRRLANPEAITLLTKGLELLKALPDTPERTQQELRLQIALGTPLIATKGYPAPEVGKTYARARELCQQVGATPQLFQVLNGLYAFHVNRAEFQTARELGEQLLALAQRQQDLSLLEVAHHCLGATLFRLGELISAREHLEQSIALCDSRKHSLQTSLYTAQFEVFSLSYLAWALWVLGRPDQAHKRSCEAVALAQELSHPLPLAYALVVAAWIHQLRQEGQAVKERAEAVIALSIEHGFPYYLAAGTMLRGWALAAQGQREDGIAEMRQGLAAYWATGAEMGRPGLLAQLSQAYKQMGQVEEGLSVLAEALALVTKLGERWYEAELYRLKGELTLQSSVQSLGSGVKKSGKSKVESQKSKASSPQHLTPSTQAEAEACFLKAIEIACKQQAKSLELRATVSLARLWRQQGRKKEARKLLAEIYSWFTEGFDTKDLQEARALLGKLS